MQRTRLTDNLLKSSYTKTDYNPGGAIGSQTNNDTGRKANGSFRSISDVTVSDFVERRSRGDVIMNPATLTKQIRSCPVDDLYFGEHPIWGARRFQGTLACEWSVAPSVPLWFTADVTAAESNVLVKAYSKMNESSMLSLVTLAEAKKTAAMLSSPFSRSLELVQKASSRIAWMRSNRKSFNRVSAFASAWLEYRYGWIPLIFDIQAALKAYNKVRESCKPMRLVARSGWNGEWSQTITNHPNISGLSSLDMDQSYFHEAKVSSGVVFDIVDANARSSVGREFGLTLDSLPSSILELVPYSFVVDWFYNVSGWLRAVTPAPGIEVRGNWVTTVYKQLNTATIAQAKIIVNNSPATTYTQSGGTYTEILWTTRRSVNLPLATTPPKVPGGLSLTHSADAAALIWQYLQRLRKA